MALDVIQIEPLDVWSVRDGRPFDVGGVVHARALWPPSPWTLLGMLRTLLCETLGVAAVDYGASRPGRPEVERVDALLGRPDTEPTFRVGPALLARCGPGRREVLWPLPADVVTFTDAASRSVAFGRLRRVGREDLESFGARASGTKRGVHLCSPAMPPGFAHADKKTAADTLANAELTAWLAGEVPEPRKSGGDWIARDDVLGSEPRIGIGLNPETGTVQEGRFYVRHAHSLQTNWRLLLPVIDRGSDGVPWEAIHGQCARLGADGHLARLELSAGADPWPPAPVERVRAEGRAVLLFLSPVRREDLSGLSIDGVPVRTCAVAAGRAVAIGGWQLRSTGKRQVGPRPLRRYCPAGTVAFVRLDRDLSVLHGTSVATDAGERAAGFGFCLVGAWPSEEKR